MSAEDCVADVAFILSECVRFREDMNRLGASAWLKTLPKEDALSFLPDPFGKGSMICGRAALQRLQILANIAIRNSDAAGTLSPKRVDEALRRIVVQHFFRDKYPVNAQQVQNALAAAVDAAKSDRSDETHFVPCRLASTTEPTQFNVGPVIFRPREIFDAVIKHHVEEMEEREKGAGLASGRDRKLIEDYYGAFDWVAEVRVLNCDRDISEERARRAACAAIDILQVVLGAGYTKRMVAGGHARANDQRTHLRLSRDGKASLSRQWQATSPVGLSNLKEILADPEVAFLLKSGGRAIEPIVDASLDWPVSRRLIEAASWYGEAVREEFAAARIVKAVTALERLLITNEKDKKIATVSDRGAALASYPPSQFEFAGWKDRLQLAYRLRSNLVHGSLSPFDPEVRQRSSWCVWLSAEVLKTALGRFGVSGGLDQKVTNARLSQWFNELVAKAQSRPRPDRPS